MDIQRAIAAVVISFVILVGYQYLFVGFGPQKQVEQVSLQPDVEQQVAQPVQTTSQENFVPPPVADSPSSGTSMGLAKKQGKDIRVETELYTAVLTENGGAVKSFVLKEHKEEARSDSSGKQLIKTDSQQGLPLKFSWGSLGGENIIFDSSTQEVWFDAGEKTTLKMTGRTGNGLEVERHYEFDKQSYLFNLSVRVKNISQGPLQGAPFLGQVNAPFQGGGGTNRYLFSGPAVYVGDALEEIKAKEFETGSKAVQGPVQWAAYEGTYFMCAVVPGQGFGQMVTLKGNEDVVRMWISGDLDTLQPGEEKIYDYTIYYGPKKVSLLKGIGYNLEKSIDFGWFDVLARPTLVLLNFLHDYVKNYGIAIILVTILFKAIFWPITQKGMKSMKNMQKLQPKMAKIKEKYKDDPTKMNQEVMNLYKTYKVNPLGGCLPMLLQIPVFFALYKVLLQCIELRHAPFMLWITDLSAPDRLWMDLGIPYLGGIPVLTLLMGASMFLQQKLTPTTADPTQAKIMMFLPVIFTFMFLNFASGLVLYWFVNNLLAILQQQLINRGSKTAIA